MKTFTLCLKIFIFLLLIWIFHCFYNYDFNRSLNYKDTLQIKNRLKDERMLAESGILKKKQTCIKERLEHYPSSEKNNKYDVLVYFKNIYNIWYNAIILSICELLSKKNDEMIKKCQVKEVDALRKNTSLFLCPQLSMTH
ncbi:fam-g protein [Plasmodium gallinaceum]|uniref:Fam-g protein n=1 Tax=Plasmodium gallinaceum TaxID=5849 RepID=A0A1J1GQG2_PLAGA|nr:fam-g protein [Plasmodium gallinaceum]CRG94506.1 fam-g protein [Plasmodium gallinaceum]